MQKYGFDDARPILERASARETAARVALAAVARAFLRQASGIEVLSHVVRIGGAAVGAGRPPCPSRRPRRHRREPGALPRRGRRRRRWWPRSPTPHRDGDTLGGVVEVLAYGLPPGLGSHVHWDRRLDARLAAALMGIQAIKGVEVGDGFGLAAVRGSQAHDEIVAGGVRPRAHVRQVRRHRGRHDQRRGRCACGRR